MGGAARPVGDGVIMCETIGVSKGAKFRAPKFGQLSPANIINNAQFNFFMVILNKGEGHLRQQMSLVASTHVKTMETKHMVTQVAPVLARGTYPQATRDILAAYRFPPLPAPWQGCTDPNCDCQFYDDLFTDEDLNDGTISY